MKVYNTFYKLLIVFILFITATSCKDEVKEIVTKKSTILPNGMHITIEKTDIETTSIGIFTTTNYSRSHRFKYKVNVDEGNITWDFGVGEPKHFLFCDEEVYIHYLNETSYVEEVKDSVNASTEENRFTKIENLYQKHIDKRYFFKLFGEDFWVDVEEEEYNKAKNTGKEFPIPNDNELRLEEE